ncbi:NitT/TauT family transport system substrate-binding protein [Promicromonospora sp. AC04]|uniref:ABC transporter substrate-binding protein n=1 Tax=Promicromonospora sp. AC04 TaxID=2135723 RepID=UPI000D47CE8D|nr:ABC transporter substrate-binding protein [Promicromonospora sp. AC04]PUB24974.1 NitT/TauT family transport system substrate-binding protein [Promicromonospora sp. AC04]
MRRTYPFAASSAAPRTARAVVAAAAATLLLAACGAQAAPGGEEGDSADGGLTTVTVGVIPIVDVAPIYLGVQEGFFEDQGLEVKLELAQGGAAIVPAVVSGEYQFGFSNVTSLLVASSQGLPLKAVAPGNFTTGTPGEDFGAVVVPEDSDIEDAADLAGKTVAVNTLNNIGDTTIRKVVADADGDPTAVEFVEMAFPDMPAAVAGDQVDAAWIVEPHLTRALQDGARVVTSNFAETDPELLVAAYFTSEQQIAEDPETVEAFTAAMEESLTFAEEHPDETRAVLDTYTEIDPAVKEAMVMPRFAPGLEASSFQVLADLGLEYGMFDEPVDVSQLLP